MANDNEAKRPQDGQAGEESIQLTPEQARAVADQLRAIMEKPEEELTPQEMAVKEMAKSRYVVYRHIKIELKPGYILRKVGQAYMVMPTGPRMKDYEGMITLNETGAFLFRELEKPDADDETLKAACIAEYDATPEEAEEAVDTFLRQCADCGLLEYEEKYYDKVTQKEVTPEEINEQEP